MATKRALIIEDETTVQGILSTFFHRLAREEGWEAEVKGFADPVQGLFELTTNGEAYDVVLLDIRMPKFTGDEIYHSMEHVRPDILDRILFVTGYPEDLEERFPGRALRVLPKPFRYEAFAAKVREILSPSG